MYVQVNSVTVINMCNLYRSMLDQKICCIIATLFKWFSFEFSKHTFSIHFVHKNLIPLGIRLLCINCMENVCLLNSKLNLKNSNKHNYNLKYSYKLCLLHCLPYNKRISRSSKNGNGICVLCKIFIWFNFELREYTEIFNKTSDFICIYSFLNIIINNNKYFL